MATRRAVLQYCSGLLLLGLQFRQDSNFGTTPDTVIELASAIVPIPSAVRVGEAYVRACPGEGSIDKLENHLRFLGRFDANKQNDLAEAAKAVRDRSMSDFSTGQFLKLNRCTISVTEGRISALVLLALTQDSRKRS